jgi:Spy/CpxP family protein refolding chaperone
MRNIMRNIYSKRLALILAAAGFVFTAMVTSAQQPPAPGAPPGQAPAGAPGPGGGRGGGRGGGLPGATPEQTQAVADMNAALAALNAAVTAARNELATVTFADVKNEAGIRAAVEKLRTAELTLASKRADEFAKLQAGPNKLNAEQVTALIAAGGNPAAGGRGRGAGPGRGDAPGAPGAAPAGAAPGTGAPGAPAGRGRGGGAPGAVPRPF